MVVETKLMDGLNGRQSTPQRDQADQWGLSYLHEVRGNPPAKSIEKTRSRLPSPTSHLELRDCDGGQESDYNAAKNIGLRYMRKRRHSLRSSPTSGGADAPADVRITGGTVNGDGYRPTADS